MNKKVLIDIDMDYFVKPVFNLAVNEFRIYKDEACSIESPCSLISTLKNKINIPCEKHIFTNHKKSYIYWWMKRYQDCTLIHIDAHSDLYKNKQKDLRLLNDIDMNCDDYIWYAIRDGFVNEIFWVIPQGLMDLTREGVSKTIGQALINNIDVKEKSAVIDFSVITRKQSNKKIKLHISEIDGLPDFGNAAEMLTMATSPEFIPKEADVLLDELSILIDFSKENIDYVRKKHADMLNITQEEIVKAKEKICIK